MIIKFSSHAKRRAKLYEIPCYIMYDFFDGFDDFDNDNFLDNDLLEGNLEGQLDEPFAEEPDHEDEPDEAESQDDDLTVDHFFIDGAVQWVLPMMKA